MWEWIIPTAITYWTWRTIKKSFQFKKLEKNTKKREWEEFNEAILFEKLKRNLMEWKLISYKENWNYSIYETRFRGYRIVIEERENTCECWMEDNDNRLNYRLRGKNVNGQWTWTKESFSRKMANTYTNAKQMETLMMMAEEGKWKRNVNKTHREYYPLINKALQISKKIDEDIYRKIKELVPFHIQMLTKKNELDEKSRRKYFEEIPQKIHFVLEGYNRLHPTYQKEEKENVLNYIEKIADIYRYNQSDGRKEFLIIEE